VPNSLFYLHNESVNVYSHLLGAIAFLVAARLLLAHLKPLYRTASAEDVMVFACFFFGCVFCLSMSATFHLISNHSAAVSGWANMLDYLGIVLLIWGSFIPSIYYGFQHRIDLIKLYWTMVRHLPSLPMPVY
jgi:adiponectin receptor